MAVSLLTLSPFATVFAGPIQVLAPVVNADGRLGLCDVLSGNVPGQSGTTWAQLAYNAGARINRWEFRWDRIEPRRAHWDFSATDAVVSGDQQAGIGVEGIIDGTPGWGSGKGQPPGNGVPKGLRLPITDSRNLWADFIRGLVAHYRGQVKYWEIWNEPDLAFFWHGTANDYYRLLRVAYRTIKQVDPSAQVLIAGMVDPSMSFLQHVLDDGARYGTAPAQRAFDIASWHAYGAARSLYWNLLKLRHLIAIRGFGTVPIWVTEDGFPASDPNGIPRQAAYVLQSIAYALAAGADKVLVYRASDDPLPKTWGLVSSSGVPRPGYVAFQVAAEYLASTQVVSYVPTGNLERFVFYQPDRRITLMWNRGIKDQTFSVPAGHPTISAIDWQGVTSALTPIAGAIQVTAPGASYDAGGVDPRAAIVGGPPVLLAEDNTAPSNLSNQTYLTPVSGANRSLLVLNPGDTPSTVQVSASNRPNERQVVQLAPQSLGTIDLDLLSGRNYHGMYLLSSTTPILGEAASTRATQHNIQPSADWLLPAAPLPLTLRNPSRAAMTVSLKAYDHRGHAAGHAMVKIAGLGSASWSPSTGRKGPFSLEVHGSAPLLLQGSQSQAAQGTSVPRTSWALVHPPAGHVAIFNPGPGTSHIDVSFVGSPEVKGEQLHLSAHHSYSLATYGAKAVVLNSTTPVAVNDQANSPSAVPPAPAPATQSAFAATGSTTRVNLFNPTQQDAHLTLSLITPAGSAQRTRVLKPLQVGSFHARKAGGPPDGVLVTSDIPVVAAPAS